MKHNYSLYYNHVRLRPMEERDIDRLRKWRNNKSISKFLKPISFITRDMQKKWFYQYLDNQNEITFAVTDVERNDIIVGSISIYNFNESQAEIGKFVIGDKNAHGRQIGTKAFIMGVFFAFEVLKVDKVICFVHKENSVARHIYRKIGFYITGERKTKDIGVEKKMEIDRQVFERVNSCYNAITMR